VPYGTKYSRIAVVRVRNKLFMRGGLHDSKIAYPQGL